jgi:hypothetical protein
MDIVPHYEFGEGELSNKKQVFHIPARLGEDGFSNMVEDLPDIDALSISRQFIEPFDPYVMIFPEQFKKGDVNYDVFFTASEGIAPVTRFPDDIDRQ